MLDLAELERIATQAFTEDYESRKRARADIYRRIDRLSSFRIRCLLGDNPGESINIDGFTFHDELEADGYLAELSSELKESEVEYDQ